jgi:hypothetical protein
MIDMKHQKWMMHTNVIVVTKQPKLAISSAIKGILGGSI